MDLKTCCPENLSINLNQIDGAYFKRILKHEYPDSLENGKIVRIGYNEIIC